MSDKRPTMYELLEIVRKENNAWHEKMDTRVSALEKRDYARRVTGRLVHAAVTLVVAALGAIAGMKWGG